MKSIATAIGLLIAVELLGLQTNQAKDSVNGQRVFEAMFHLTFGIICQLKFGAFDWQVLKASGITRDNWPWLYFIFYDWSA